MRGINKHVREECLTWVTFPIKAFFFSFSPFNMSKDTAPGNVSSILISYKRRLNCQKQWSIWSLIRNIISGCGAAGFWSSLSFQSELQLEIKEKLQREVIMGSLK